MKKLKLTKKTGLLSLIVVTVLGLGACTAHHAHPRNMDPAKILKRVSKKLDLNENQQSKLKPALETAASFKLEMSSRHDQFSAPLKKNLSQPTIDVDELNSHFDELGADLNQFRKTMLTQYAEFHASLNEEQRGKLTDFMDKMEKHKRY